jgi:hypothetical protein
MAILPLLAAVKFLGSASLEKTEDRSASEGSAVWREGTFFSFGLESDETTWRKVRDKLEERKPFPRAVRIVLLSLDLALFGMLLEVLGEGLGVREAVKHGERLGCVVLQSMYRWKRETVMVRHQAITQVSYAGVTGPLGRHGAEWMLSPLVTEDTSWCLTLLGDRSPCMV